MFACFFLPLWHIAFEVVWRYKHDSKLPVLSPYCMVTILISLKFLVDPVILECEKRAF